MKKKLKCFEIENVSSAADSSSSSRMVLCRFYSSMHAWFYRTDTAAAACSSSRMVPMAMGSLHVDCRMECQQVLFEQEVFYFHSHFFFFDTQRSRNYICTRLLRYTVAGVRWQVALKMKALEHFVLIPSYSYLRTLLFLIKTFKNKLRRTKFVRSLGSLGSSRIRTNSYAYVVVGYSVYVYKRSTAGTCQVSLKRSADNASRLTATLCCLKLNVY